MRWKRVYTPGFRRVSIFSGSFFEYAVSARLSSFLLAAKIRFYIYIYTIFYIYIYYIEVGPKARNSPVNWLVCEIDDRSGKSVRSFLRQLVPCLAGTTPRGGEKKIELEGEVFARRNGEKELERGGRKRSGVRPPSWVSGNKSRCYIYVYIYRSKWWTVVGGA